MRWRRRRSACRRAGRRNAGKVIRSSTRAGAGRPRCTRRPRRTHRGGGDAPHVGTDLVLREHDEHDRVGAEVGARSAPTGPAHRRARAGPPRRRPGGALGDAARRRRDRRRAARATADRAPTRAARAAPNARARSSAPAARPRPSPSATATAPASEQCRADRRQLRLPQVREVGEPAHEPDHRADQQRRRRALRPGAARGPDRDARQRPTRSPTRSCRRRTARSSSSCVPARATSAVIVCAMSTPTSTTSAAIARFGRDARATKNPITNSPTINAAHGHPLGPGTHSSEPCTTTVCDAVTEHDGPLRVDRVNDPGIVAHRRVAATCPSSGCGGRARSRCALPRCDASAAASTRRFPSRSPGSACSRGACG